MQPLAPVDFVRDAPRAGLLLKPLRLRILEAAREPRSASAIAAVLGLPRQRVNYHVRQLERGGFLRRAGRRRKRGLTEQDYVVSARAFVLSPDVLGAMSPQTRDTADRMSAAYLLALAVRMQREAGRAWREAHKAGKRLPVLSIDTEIAFASAAERARFADRLTEAVARTVAEHSQPAGAPGSGPFRLVIGCYPVPPGNETSHRAGSRRIAASAHEEHA